MIDAAEVGKWQHEWYVYLFDKRDPYDDAKCGFLDKSGKLHRSSRELKISCKTYREAVGLLKTHRPKMSIVKRLSIGNGRHLISTETVKFFIEV